MGRLAIISDLHADINQFGERELNILLQVLQEQQVTRVHFAGDSGNKMETALQVQHFFNHAFPTTFNLGNHEMADIKGEAMIEHYPDSHFLNLRYLPLNTKTVLLGMNGWYDYSFSTIAEEEKNRANKNRFWYDRMIQRDASDPVINQRILQSLEQELDRLAENNYQVILATHFVPQQKFIVELSGKYQIWNQLNAFLGSANLGKLLNRYHNLKQVVFGHTHRRFEDTKIHGTLYSCRPFGYFYEWQITRDFVLKNQLAPEFIPMKMRKILRDNQAAFKAYQQLHLAEEFKRGMTLIDYEA